MFKFLPKNPTLLYLPWGLCKKREVQLELVSHNSQQSHCYCDDSCDWNDGTCWVAGDNSSLPGLSPWRKRETGFNLKYSTPLHAAGCDLDGGGVRWLAAAVTSLLSSDASLLRPRRRGRPSLLLLLLRIVGMSLSKNSSSTRTYIKYTVTIFVRFHDNLPSCIIIRHSSLYLNASSVFSCTFNGQRIACMESQSDCISSF